jgi:Papain family cysteine protease
MHPRQMFALLSSLLLLTPLVLVPASAHRQTRGQMQGQTQAAGATRQADDERQASPAARAALDKLRAEKKTYRVGHSSAFEVTVRDLADIEIPPDLPKTLPRVRQESARRLAKQRAGQAQYIREHPRTEFRPVWDLYEFLKAGFQKHYPGGRVPRTVAALAPYVGQFDWQEFLILYVLDQQPCNSCWAFASVAAFEANVQLQNLKAEYMHIQPDPTGQSDIAVLPPHLRMPRKYSEQDLINCIGHKQADCIAGGWPGSAFDFMIKKGLVRAGTRRDRVYYRGQELPCEPTTEEKARAAAWGYVTYPPKSPTVLQIKRALLEHGPVVALVRIDAGKKFQSYKGGVFNEHDPGAPNHAILIVGWDDTLKAWRIQNSWGLEWGEQGLMWIAYDSNSVGKYAAWVEAPVSSDRGLLGANAIEASAFPILAASGHENVNH